MHFMQQSDISQAALGAIESALELMRDTTALTATGKTQIMRSISRSRKPRTTTSFCRRCKALKDHINVGMKLHGLSLLGPAGGLVGVLDEHDAIFAASATDVKTMPATL